MIDNPNIQIKKTNRNILYFLIILIFFTVLVFIKFLPILTSKNKKQEQNSNIVTITTPNQIISSDIIWPEHLQNKIEEETIKLQDSATKSILELKELIESMKQEQLTAISELNARIEIQNSQLELLHIEKSKNTHINSTNDYSLNSVTSDTKDDLPKDIGIYIPATTYVSSRLLSGISVSTGVSAQSNPLPVIMRLVDIAKLPNQFHSNLKDCRILGSCHGDISSERAMIRLEALICINKKTMQTVEIKTSGFVVGPDGLVGIRGIVVSMDTKHMKYAFIGGMLGGLSKSASSKNSMLFNPNVGIVTHKQTFADNIQEGTISGVTSATDKISDYYIRKAESISPVIQVPSGVKVDVVFTQGVYYMDSKSPLLINDSLNLRKDTYGQ